MNKEKAIAELSRQRNRHVGKLLSFLGDSPPYLEMAIKREFTLFQEDVLENIINSDQDGNYENQWNQPTE